MTVDFKEIEQLTDSQDLQQSTDGALILNDPECVAAQRSIAIDFLKQIGKNLLSGKSIMRVALPIKKAVFRDMSQLEMLFEAYDNIQYLMKASFSNNMTRVQHCAAFVINGLLPTVVNQLKPFNPIIGETYDLRTKFQYDGNTYILKRSSEQVINHPPTSAFIIKVLDDQKKLVLQVSGGLALEATTGGNVVKIARGGITQIEFFQESPRFVQYTFPELKVTGLFFGQRYGYFCKNIMMGCSDNCEFPANYYLKGSELLLVQDISEIQIGKPGGLFSKSSLKCDQLSGQVCYRERSAPVSGSWQSQYKIGDYDFQIGDAKLVETVDQLKGQEVGSNCKRRIDIRMFHDGEVDLANEEKLRLEQVQRDERKLREVRGKSDD